MTGFEKLNLMRKKCSLIIGLALISGGVVSGFKKYENNVLEQYRILPDQPLSYCFPNLDKVVEEKEAVADVLVPFTGKTYVGFKQALAVRESYGLYDIVNSYGYMGKYQFGKMALRSIGLFDATEFLKNPEMQEKAFDALIAKNKWILKDEIRKFVGRNVGGVRITESGILAAAHLGGAGSVKRFLKSNGQKKFSDGFGTSIGSYLKIFGGFDTSDISAEKNPIVMI